MCNDLHSIYMRMETILLKWIGWNSLMENVSLYVCFTMRAFLLAGEMGLFIVAHLVGIPGHYSTRVFLCYTTNEKDGCYIA